MSNFGLRRTFHLPQAKQEETRKEPQLPRALTADELRIHAIVSRLTCETRLPTTISEVRTFINDGIASTDEWSQERVEEAVRMLNSRGIIKYSGADNISF